MTAPTFSARETLVRRVRPCPPQAGGRRLPPAPQAALRQPRKQPASAPAPTAVPAASASSHLTGASASRARASTRDAPEADPGSGHRKQTPAAHRKRTSGAHRKRTPGASRIAAVLPPPRTRRVADGARDPFQRLEPRARGRQDTEDTDQSLRLRSLRSAAAVEPGGHTESSLRGNENRAPAAPEDATHSRAVLPRAHQQGCPGRLDGGARATLHTVPWTSAALDQCREQGVVPPPRRRGGAAGLVLAS